MTTTPVLDDIETICANSFRNFHAKGMDYLCLKRSESMTTKVYFFEGNLAHLPEIVMPHDHRYDFRTTILSGEVGNRRYEQGRHPDVGPSILFDRFEYDTPLNGGDGFSWRDEQWLTEYPEAVYRPGQAYLSPFWELHTLNVRAEGSVIVLEQKHDRMPVGEPTQAFRKAYDRTPPSLDGLYDRMTPDHARKRIQQYQSIIGGH